MEKKLFEKVILGFILVAVIISLYNRYFVIFSYSPDTGGMEYELIYEIQRILAGLPLYPDPAHLPYHLTQKTPLYHFMVAGVAYLFQIDATDVYKIYLTSRIVTFSIILLVVTLSYRIGKRIFNFNTIESVIYCLSIELILGHSHHYYSRMDVLYCFFFLLLFYYLNQFKWEIDLKKCFIYSGLSVLLFFTKQQGLAIIPFVGFSLLLNKQSPILVINYGIISILLIGGIPLFLGQDLKLLYKNVIVGINNGIDFTFLNYYWTSEFQLLFNLFTLFSAVMVFIKNRQSSEIKIFNLLLFLLLFFILGLVTSLKYGAGNNYFTEYKILALTTFMIFLKTSPLSLFKSLFGLSFFMLISVMGIKDEDILSLRKNRITDLDNYQNELLATEYLLDRESTNKVPSILVFRKPSMLNNLLFPHVILPTKATFRATFNKSKNPAKASVHNSFDNNILNYIILSKRDPQNLIFMDYPLNGYTLEKTFGEIKIYTKKIPSTQ